MTAAKTDWWCGALVILTIAFLLSCTPSPSNLSPEVSVTPSNPSVSPDSVSSPSPLEAQPMENAIAFEVFDVGLNPLNNQSIQQPQVMVFRNQSDWATLWNRSNLLDRNLQPLPPPTVNFERQMVIAVTLGSRTTGGYRVQIDRIEDGGDRWTVHYTETEPGSTCIVTQAITTPTVFVLVSRSDGAIGLQGRKLTQSC